MRKRDAGFYACAGKADDVFRTDITGKNRSADHVPGNVPAGEEIILCSLCFLFHDVPSNSTDDDKVQEYNRPVDP